MAEEVLIIGVTYGNLRVYTVIFMLGILLSGSFEHTFYSQAAAQKVAGMDCFVADKSLNTYRGAHVFKKVLSEPIGADLPRLCFFNSRIVCILNYNGLLIFDTATGKLRDAIDIQGLGFQTQGDSAIEVRGNRNYVTFVTAGGDKGYIYEIATSQLGFLGKQEKLRYTPVQVPAQAVLAGLEKIDLSKVWSALEAPEGIAVCSMELNDLAKTRILIYSADKRLMKEFTLGRATDEE